MSPLTRSSTSTYGHIDPGPGPLFDDDSSQEQDVEMTFEEQQQAIEDLVMNECIEEDDSMDSDPINCITEERLVIAIDFGTTFSSVAYTVLPKGVSPENVNLRSVKCIGNYPGYKPAPGRSDLRLDVPTELWYYDGSLESPRQNTTRNENIAGNSGSDSESSSDEDNSDTEDSQSEFTDDGGVGQTANTRGKKFRLTPATQYWGYGVQRKLINMSIPKDDARPLMKFKLKLDESDRGRAVGEVRAEITTALKALRRKRIIQDDTDVYFHFLSHLLGHTKKQLEFTNEYHADAVIQFVLCVPAKWPLRACRIMQSSLEKAVMEVGLGNQANGGICDIFMISEPEAAAECILAESGSELFFNETVVIVDAGGGTVDAVTYRCTNSEPLRLSEEVVPPDSDLCGASMINDRFEKKLLQKLSRETYLETSRKTLKSIAQAKTADFENFEKRIIDVNMKKFLIDSIFIDDLRPNAAKDLYENRLRLRRKHMRDFFQPSLEGVKRVLENQLELAENKNHRVEKVILTGGFGQSPSLQSYLKDFLQGRTSTKGWTIELIAPTNPSTAVARGAVLRALNKRFGPTRKSQCSYGFIISEPFDQERVEAHRGTKCRINKADGEKYVDETIRWVIQAGDTVENMQIFTFPVRHTFPITHKHLLCAEELWMSDNCHPNHYRKTHALNKGAVKVGSITADLTKLKDEGCIIPQRPSEHSIHFGSQKMYWEVFYEIAMIVEGRSIRFEARWPTTENLKAGEKQDILGARLVGITAAFQPGTV